MSFTYIPSEEELKKIVSECVRDVIEDTLPSAIHKANRKQWVTTTEVMKILQCSRRHVQYLRDSQQLPFTQNGHTIRYKVDEVEAFLNECRVDSIGRK